MPADRVGSFGYWRDPVFLVSCGVYAVNRCLIKPNLHHYSSFFHGHLNDMLVVPVLLPIYLFVYRWLHLRPDDAPPRWWEIAAHLMVWIAFFEWFGPAVLHQGVYDPLDNWSMAGGGVVAWLLWQRDALTRFFPPRDNDGS